MGNWRSRIGRVLFYASVSITLFLAFSLVFIPQWVFVLFQPYCALLAVLVCIGMPVGAVLALRD